MTDLAGQTPDPASALEAEAEPAAPTVDIETLVSQITEKVIAGIQPQIDKRFGGFQQVIAKKDQELSTLQHELKNLRLAGLSEEEREQVLQSEKDAQIAQLQAELELERLGRQYPDLIEEYRQLLSAETAEEQLLRLKALREAQAAAATPTPEPQAEPTVPEVDPNLPATHTEISLGERMVDPDLMTDELADRILRAHGDAPLRVE